MRRLLSARWWSVSLVELADVVVRSSAEHVEAGMNMGVLKGAMGVLDAC